MSQLAHAGLTTATQPAFELTAVFPTRKHSVISILEMGAILIASPHPDDETLGCGGLISICASVAHPVSILAMTNGDASHPGDSAWRARLGEIRKGEQRSALRILGLQHSDLISLELPDGELNRLRDANRAKVIGHIHDVLQARNIQSVFIPAIDDCHDDHGETARLLVEVVANFPLKYVFSYQIWPPATRPQHVSRNETAYRLNITNVLTLKTRAIQQYRTQLGVIDSAHTEGFQMPQVLLEQKLKKYEHYALVQNLDAWST